MQYDFSLAAGAAQSFDVVGTFVKYQSGTGLIRVRMSMGEYVDLLPGQGVFSVNYTRFTVTDRSGVSNVGALLAGDFDFRDSRITGVVSILDGGQDRTRSGVTFLGGVNCAGVAGQYSSMQLWNPVGSGKIAVVQSLYASSAFAGSASLKRYATILPSQNTPAQSKMAGLPNSVMLMRYGTLAGFVGDGTYGAKYMAANGQAEFKFAEPIILVPGQGLMVQSALAQDMVTYFEYFEQDQ